MNNKEQFLKELEEIKRDYTEHDWDGYGALPLNKTSAEFAEKFISETASIYPDLPYPDLAVEPDGSLGFDWQLDEYWLCISIDERGVLHYASRGEPDVKGFFHLNLMDSKSNVHQFPVLREICNRMKEERIKLQRDMVIWQLILVGLDFVIVCPILAIIILLPFGLGVKHVLFGVLVSVLVFSLFLVRYFWAETYKPKPKYKLSYKQPPTGGTEESGIQM
jgi:hypothetical protein